ncbi:hypothetical protein HKD37_17G048991 [Glycine soja]
MRHDLMYLEDAQQNCVDTGFFKPLPKVVQWPVQFPKSNEDLTQLCLKTNAIRKCGHEHFYIRRVERMGAQGSAESMDIDELRVLNLHLIFSGRDRKRVSLTAGGKRKDNILAIH